MSPRLLERCFVGVGKMVIRETIINMQLIHQNKVVDRPSRHSYLKVDCFGHGHCWPWPAPLYHSILNSLESSSPATSVQCTLRRQQITVTRTALTWRQVDVVFYVIGCLVHHLFFSRCGLGVLLLHFASDLVRFLEGLDPRECCIAVVGE